MTNLVIMENHQAVTTSLKVAEVFGKDHKHVLEAIDNKIQSAENSADYQKMFLEGTYQDSRGRNQKMYYMNRDGFTFIAFGFTGKRADEFKLQYINAFNQMEEQIKAGLPQTTDEKIYLLLQSASDKNKRLTKAENRLDKLENDQPLAPGEYNYIGRQVSAAVGRYVRAHHLALSNSQRSKLFKDINRGLNEVTGIKTRTQLRKKDFEAATEFIQEWAPSTATLTVIKQLGGEAEGQTELV